MRRLAVPLLIASAVLLAAAAPSSAPPLAFEASFPERPKHEIAEKVLEYSSGKKPKLEIHRYSVEQDTGIFVVTWFYVPKEMFEDAATYSGNAVDKEKVREKTAVAFVEETVKGVAGSLGGRVEKNARLERKDRIEAEFNGALLGDDKKSTVGRFEGKAILVYDRPTRRHVMYTAVAATAADRASHQRAAAFVQSFTLKPVRP